MSRITMSGAAEIPSKTGLIVDGAAKKGRGLELPVFYPGDGEQISLLEEATDEDVDLAVAAARRAFDGGVWPNMPVTERQKILYRIRDLVQENAEQLAMLECYNTGLPLRELKARHMMRAAYNFQFFAEYIAHARGDCYGQTPGYLTYVVREPVGVAALLAPWNAPVALASMKLAAAIAFGNCCVLKPSEQTPLAIYRLIELMHEAGLPPGVVNLVNGRGPATGQALVSHPDIDLVSFTGGTETGRAIMSAAGRNLVPCTMELGGKSANIIFASADQERALDGALMGIFSNNGQQCLAGSRILVERSIADTFIDRFIARAEKICVGDPMDESTELGPIASQTHMRRVLSFVDIAKEDGGELLTGGARREDLGGGYYIRPTAVKVASNSVRVAQEEIFGPFATFMTFETAEQAFAMANDTAFGLVSYVWSDHHPTVMAATNALRSGVVWVNTPMMRELRAPFGGYKDSGIGREGGAACEQFYSQEKTVSLPLIEVPLRRFGSRD